jgi:hypothetical protein
MSTPRFEAFLARVLVDGSFRAAFLADSAEVARAAGLDASECDALTGIDRAGLLMAAESLQHKRARQQPCPGQGPLAGLGRVVRRRWAQVLAYCRVKSTRSFRSFS